MFLHAQGGRTIVTPMESSRNVITNDSSEESSTPIYQDYDDKPLWQKIQEEKEKEQENENRIEREKFVADSLEKVRIANENAELERQRKEKVEAERHAKEQKRIERLSQKSSFIMATGAYSFCPQYSFGLKYGQVIRLGWYVNVMSNFNFSFDAKYEADENGFVNGIKPLYSGNEQISYLSSTIGVIARLNYFTHIYGGLGYSYRNVFRELMGGEWVLSKTNTSYKYGLYYDCGVIFNLNNFAISVGGAGVTNFRANLLEIKIGVGYFINKRK